MFSSLFCISHLIILFEAGMSQFKESEFKFSKTVSIISCFDDSIIFRNELKNKLFIAKDLEIKLSEEIFGIL